jgi:class 3 adenylate cyclase/predicted ATPase
MDVRDWLKALGLGQYASAFAENDIDFAILNKLTDSDLRELGVSSLGHRKRLLEAIADRDARTPRAASADLKALNTAGLRPPEQIVTGAAPLSPVAGEAKGERRHVTVLFADLVDSTGIASGLDAEEWRDLVGAYLDTTSAAVTAMGGTVSKKLGDGLMALFGYPTAQENDAERAVRAALAIQRSLAELSLKNADAGKPALIARIAIDSGPVVVDALGEIFGDVPNIAARTQQLAEPGSVLVTERVQRQVAGLFVVQDRGSRSLKGVPAPVMLFRIVRASGAGRRSSRRHLTSMVGRDEEIAILMRRWERARQGDGQLVLIIGEPGLGKTRLLDEFHSRLADTPHTWTEWSFLQLLQNTPLHPIAEWGRQRFGGSDVPAERRLAELENSLVQVTLDPDENTPLLAPLLDIPLPLDRAPSLLPDELRRRQLAALIAWSIASARIQPLVLALEDLHWADPTSLDLLRSIAERGALAPLFILATARPEFRPPWGIRSHHSTVSLAPLDRAQVRDMVAELSARHALPSKVVEDVAARTEGVPLFVEEVTRLLLERGVQGGIQTIPPTLQQSFTARLDRLGPAREVAQIAAVIGRDFPYTLLRLVAGIEESDLRTALDRLAEADILLVQGLPPNSDYHFKHTLIQGAAYENLLKSRRQLLHRRIGEALRDGVAGTDAPEPELLAHHFTQAGLTETAIEWLGKAGQWSLQRSALVEAAAQFTRALDQIVTLPSTPALRREHIKLQVALVTPLIHVKGYAAPETKAAAERARLLIEQAESLGEAPEDPLLLFSVLYGFWVSSFVAFDGNAMRQLAAEFLAFAERQATPAPRMVGHRNMGVTLLHIGEIEESLVHFNRAFTLYDAAEHRKLATRFGQDVRVAILFHRSLAHWALGYPEKALADAACAVAEAREVGQAPTLIPALALTSLTHIHCGNYEIANGQADEVISLAEEKGAAFWKIGGNLLKGYVLAVTGKASDAIPMITVGITTWRSTGATVWLPIFHMGLATAHAELSQFEDARRCVDEALTIIEATNERWCEAESNRIAGEIALRFPHADVAKAQAHFERALTISRKQHAKSWELRAAMSMARLWQGHGRRSDSRDLLASVYSWFTEGFGTPDLKQCTVLLDSLTS